jgi:protein O-mannosyl-transferase
MAISKPASSLNRDFARGLLLFVVTFLTYLPAWNGLPVWDDNMHMTPPDLRSLDGLLRIWTHSRESMQYFPLTHSIFWVEGNLWGDSTLGYHLISILLHVLSALMLVKVLRKLTIPGAWFAAAVFALHPIAVESVAWISELKNTLSGVFFFAAAATYLTYAETGRRRSYGLALGLFVLGLLSKTTIATFPFAMLLALWWRRGRLSWKQDIVPLLPFFLVAVLFGMITLRVEHTHIGTGEPEFGLSTIERFLLAGRAIGFYLGKLLLPVNLVFSYPRWRLSAAVWWQYLFPVAALMVGVLLWARRKVFRAPAVAFFYFTAMLLPYLGFFSFYTFRYSFVADHYQYLAAAGPMVLAVGSVERALGSASGVRLQLKTALGAIVLLALALLSWKQSGTYSSAEALHRATLAKNADSWMAHNELGILTAKAGRTDEALTHYERALALNPDSIEVQNNTGLLLANAGRSVEALALYQNVLKASPDHAKTHNNIGNLLARMGRSNEALAHYRKALQVNPDFAEVHTNAGLLLSDMGRTDEALEHYQRAVELNPYDAGTHNNLGVLLAKLGRTDEAFEHYRIALKTDPNRGDVHFNLADLLSDTGRNDEALAHYQTASEIEPNNASFHYSLGLQLSNMGRRDDAMVQYQRALQLNSNHVDAHNNLGILLVGIGQIDDALTHFRQALAIDPQALGPLTNLGFALTQSGQQADGMAVLERALNLAKSAGDKAREMNIAQFMARIQNPQQRKDAAR